MRSVLAALSAIFICGTLHANPAPVVASTSPITEMRNSQLYAHNKNWLKSFPSAFVAANIRGENMQYAERRLAALDLVRQQRDFGVVSELTLALEKGSFLDFEILSILEDWKAKRAVPLLEKIAKDPTRDKTLRDQAAKSASSIRGFKPAPPPKF